MQSRDAGGKQIKLRYKVLIIVLAMILIVPGFLFSSMVIKSDEQTNPYTVFTNSFEKTLPHENETFRILSDVNFDRPFVQQNSYDLIVDKNGEGDYITIQDAIDNAPDMATILVKAGTYAEIIEIKKSVTLIGEDSVLINPVSKKNSYSIRIGAPGTKLSKLSITNGAPGPCASGIYVCSSNTEIEDCSIYDTPIGVAVWTSSNVIKNCRFWGCRDEGVALLGSISSACNNNRITNCVFYNNCDGVELQYSSNNMIFGCEFYENTHTAIDAIAESNNENTISSCKIYNNTCNGIYLSSSSNNLITGCYISNNKNGDVVEIGNSYNNEITS